MLAEKSGIAQPVIAKYELGHQPSARNLNRLCTALGVNASYFYCTLQNVSNIQFDEEEFDKMIKKAKGLSLNNKLMIKTVLAQALYFQELENDVAEKIEQANPKSLSKR